MATSFTDTRRVQLWHEYAAWLLTDRSERILHKMPMTDREWGSKKGTSDRTLRTWKADPEFQKLLDTKRRERVMRDVPMATVASLEDKRAAGLVDAEEGFEPAGDGPERAGNDTEKQYHHLRQMLYEQARSGHERSVELWFKLYGKPFVDAENGAQESNLADMDDVALLRHTFDLVPAGRRDEMMAELGYVPA